MSRLATVGMESQRLSASSTTCGEGQGTSTSGTVSINTSTPRSGAAAALCGKSAENFLKLDIATTLGRAYFLRQALRFSAIEPSANLGLVQAFSEGAAKNLVKVYLTTGKEILLFNEFKGTNIAVTEFKPEAGVYYLFELKIKVESAGNGTVALIIRDNAGTVKYESGDKSVEIGNKAVSQFAIGHLGTETKVEVLVDDIGLNDDQGASQNSYPGFAKLVFLKPVEDVARTGWVGGAGGTTNLWEAIDNTPPVGVKLASATNTSQVKDANNNATDTYEARLAKYTDSVASGGGGMKVGDKATVVFVLVRQGNSSSTSRNLGVTGVSNPAIAESVEGTIASTAESDPTGWTTKRTAFSINPTVEVEVAPVVKIRKATASTDSLMVDLLGLYVEYTLDVAESLKKELTDSAVVSDAMQFKTSKLLADIAVVSDVLAKLTGKQLGDSVSVTDAIFKRPIKALADAVLVSDALTTKRTLGKLLSDAVTVTDALTKKVSKLLADNATVSDSKQIKFSKLLGDGVSPSDSLSKKFSKLLQDAVQVKDKITFPQFIGTFIRYLGKWVKVR